MKFFYVFVLIALSVLNSRAKADFREDMRAISKTCQEEVHISDEDLHKFFTDSFNPENVNDAIKCHIKCMMEKSGHFKDGELDIESFMEKVNNSPIFKDHSEAVAKALNDCKEVKGESECDTAFKIAMCIKESKGAAGVPSMYH